MKQAREKALNKLIKNSDTPGEEILLPGAIWKIENSTDPVSIYQFMKLTGMRHLT